MLTLKENVIRPNKIIIDCVTFTDNEILLFFEFIDLLPFNLKKSIFVNVSQKEERKISLRNLHNFRGNYV